MAPVKHTEGEAEMSCEDGDFGCVPGKKAFRVFRPTSFDEFRQRKATRLEDGSVRVVNDEGCAGEEDGVQESDRNPVKSVMIPANVVEKL